MTARSSAAWSSLSRVNATQAKLRLDIDANVGAEHDPDRHRFLGLLRRYGTHAPSFLSLKPGVRYWFNHDGGVAYGVAGRSWVVAGAPLAPADKLASVTDAFLHHARRHHARVCFVGLEGDASSQAGLEQLVIGQQPVWDPQAWPSILRSSRSLREQLRRARAKGIRIRMVEPDEVSKGRGPTARAMEALRGEWLRGRTMPPLGFLLGVHPFLFAHEQRQWVAERDGVVVAFLSAVPVYGRRGWLIENVIRAPVAPNGTTELLIDAAMRSFAEDGCGIVTLGLAPLRGEVPWGLRLIRRVARPLYDFDGLAAFKARLRPQQWEPVHLAYPPGRTALGALWDSVQPFAPQGVVGFAAATLARHPRWLVWVAAVALALTALLVVVARAV